MLKTFKAWLKGSHLEWIDEIPEVGERVIEVHVTLLENESDLTAKSRGRRMAEILANIAASQPLTLTDIEPNVWQKETRQDRSLPGR